MVRRRLYWCQIEFRIQNCRKFDDFIKVLHKKLKLNLGIKLCITRGYIMRRSILLVSIIALFIGCAQKPPTITKVDPTTVSIVGGTEITITGTGFKANPLPIVTFNGYQATYVKVINITTLKVFVPPGVTGPADIVVQDAKAKVRSMPFRGFNYYEEVVSAPPDSVSTEIIFTEGNDMVLIPAGEFQMGNSFNELGNETRPVHTVYLDAFYMDVYEVTNAQYKKFMDATGYKAPYYWNDSTYNAPNTPVVGVSWNDAKAYAEWADKRLPTEAEWEKAARGGLVGKRYSWGDNITHDDANYSGIGGKDVWTCTSPFGSFAPNGYGLYDMAGNVWEWCADWWADNYYVSSLKSNPKGPDSGSYKVLRGGSWSNPDYTLRTAYRTGAFNPPYVFNDFGFRCVKDSGSRNRSNEYYQNQPGGTQSHSKRDTSENNNKEPYYRGETEAQRDRRIQREKDMKDPAFRIGYGVGQAVGNVQNAGKAVDNLLNPKKK
jgi:sulfatase modifying factor 1